MRSRSILGSATCVFALLAVACSEPTTFYGDTRPDTRDATVGDAVQGDAGDVGRADAVDAGATDARDVLVADVQSDVPDLDTRDAAPPLDVVPPIDTVVVDSGTACGACPSGFLCCASTGLCYDPRCLSCCMPPPVDSGLCAPTEILCPDGRCVTDPLTCFMVADSGADAGGDSSGDAGGAPLYSRCRSNADCAVGFTCNLTYPGGLCTVRCTTDRTCGAAGICAGAYGCLPVCQPTLDNCQPWSGICFIFDATDPTRRGCFPSCYGTPPTGFPACVPGRVCDPHSGNCVIPPAPTTGAANGSACLTAADCAGGRCYPTMDAMTGLPNGWNNGYCFSVGRTPANADFMIGGAWPRSNCPVGSVALPAGVAPAEGDPALCVRECRMDSECRTFEGYRCFRGRNPMTGLPAFTTGGCIPVDCNMAGMACPAGYTCRTMTGTGGPYGVCGR